MPPLFPGRFLKGPDRLAEEILAGELGFEPRSSVLETDSLTVELTPPVCGGENRAWEPRLLFPTPYSLFPAYFVSL